MILKRAAQLLKVLPNSTVVSVETKAILLPVSSVSSFVFIVPVYSNLLLCLYAIWYKYRLLLTRPFNL